MDRNDSCPACMTGLQICSEQTSKLALTCEPSICILHLNSGQAYRVPYLKFDLLAINVNHSSPKLDANSQVMYRLKPFVSEL